MAAARRSRSSSRVGSAARMRVSSATRLLLERDVQVGANEDAAAFDVRLTHGARVSHSSVSFTAGGR